MELVIFSALEGLAARVEGYREVAVLAPSRLDQVLRLLGGDRPPQALYIDDSREAPAADLWRAVAAAQQAGATTLVNFYGPARTGLNDARAAGLATLSERDPAAVAAWVGAQLGLTAGGGAGRLPMLAIGAAKGGVGKTFLTCALAEGLRRRGLRVLVWDADIANPGLISAFRVPSSAPSYLHLIQRGPGQRTPSAIRPFIYQPEGTRPTAAGWGAIDLLVGAHSLTRPENDIRLHDWQGLYAGVEALDGYDLVLIDTPPDYLRRPYATHTLQAGGFVALPCPPGARERLGVGHLLDHLGEHAPERLDSCAIVFIEPERGAAVSTRDVAALFARRFPQVPALGPLPRAPRLASLADEHEHYISALDLGPRTPFAAAVHAVADGLCARVGLRPSLPMPRVSWWSRMTAGLAREGQTAPAAPALTRKTA